MCRVNSGDLMLVNFIPAFPGDMVFFRYHKKWMQVTGEGKTFIQDQSYTVVTVTRRGNDLSTHSNAGEKFSAVFEFQDKVVVLRDFNIG